MLRILSIVSLAALSLAARQATAATTITGTVQVGTTFPPSTSSVVVGDGTEFSKSFLSSVSFDFTETGLVVYESASSGIDSFTASFTADAPGFFGDLTEISSSFGGYGSLTYSVTGDTLSLAFHPSAGNYSMSASADFTFDGPATSVPEPASWMMVIAGLGLAGAAMRRLPKVTFRTI